MSFLGAWRVREYVFAPGGEALGTVAQRRQLEQAGERVRVIQDCTPDAALAGHAMAGFAGHHEFELSIDGRARRYHGPAVVGGAVSYGEGAMWGRGVWPEFAHAFDSYAFLVEPDRQLTGGRFSRAGQPVARIVGVAAPEDAGAPPTLSGPGVGAGGACELALDWHGRVRLCRPDGEWLADAPAARHYTGALSWHESGSERVSIAIAPARDDGSVRGHARGHALHGFARAYGWQLELEAACGPGTIVEWTEVLDAERGHLVGFRRWIVDHVLTRVDVLHLRPAGRPYPTEKETRA